MDKAVLTGVDFQPRWPDPALAVNQRLGTETETYEILFDTDDGKYSYHTNNVDIFAQCQIGSEWALKVNTFGGVTGIEPAR